MRILLFRSMFSLALAVLVGFTSMSFAQEGGDHSGGGDSCLLRINALTELIRQSVNQLSSIKNASIDPDLFATELTKVRFETGDQLTKAGMPVDALNFPEKHLVLLDRDRCSSVLSNLEGGMAFLVHEILGIMRIDDERYKVSRVVLNELNGIIVSRKFPEWKYVCSLQRWHYSGRAGFEALRTTDSFNGSMTATGYLYGRSDHDLDEYAVSFDISRGIYREHEPRLFYTFFRDPNHDATKRQMIVPAWTPIDFDHASKGPTGEILPAGKVTIKLLRPDGFPREGQDTSSFLEMSCYRSI